MTTKLNELDPGVPGLLALGIATEMMSTLGQAGVLTNAQAGEILQKAISNIAVGGQRDQALDLARAIFPTATLK